jgi:hypothetical protein
MVNVNVSSEMLTMSLRMNKREQEIFKAILELDSTVPEKLHENGFTRAEVRDFMNAIHTLI